jgi:hypothetical protein
VFKGVKVKKYLCAKKNEMRRKGGAMSGEK